MFLLIINNPIWPWNTGFWFLMILFFDNPFCFDHPWFFFIIHVFLILVFFGHPIWEPSILDDFNLCIFPNPTGPKTKEIRKARTVCRTGGSSAGSRIRGPGKWYTLEVETARPLKKLVLGVDYVDYFPDLGFDNLMKGLSPSKKLERRVTCKMWQADLAWLVPETWGTHEKNIWICICILIFDVWIRIYLYKHVYIYIFVCVYTIYSYYNDYMFSYFHNFCEPKRRLRFVFGLSSQSFRDCWVQFEEKTCRSDGTNKLSPLVVKMFLGKMLVPLGWYPL